MTSARPEHLMKYCSTAGATAILQSGRLRWSSPCMLQDPFELDHHSELAFDPQQLLQSAINLATSLIFAREAPGGNTPLMQAIRRWREEERFASPEEADSVLRELLSRVVDQRLGLLEQLMTEWRRYARSLRVCCFLAKADNLGAWHSFADNHRGVVLRLHAAEDTLLSAPQKITYQAARPQITTLQNEIAAIVGRPHMTAQEHFAEKFLCKGLHQSHEQEWRCLQSRPDEPGAPQRPDTQLFDDLKFEQRQLSGLYFGTHTPATEKRQLQQLLKEKYPQAKMFQAHAVSGKYEVVFERL